METLREKKTELLRAGIIGAIGLTFFLLLVLAFALACGGWLLEEELAPHFTRAALAVLCALTGFCSARGQKGVQILPALVGSAGLCLLPLLLAVCSPSAGFPVLPFLFSFFCALAGTFFGLALAMKPGRRKKRRRKTAAHTGIL